MAKVLNKDDAVSLILGYLLGGFHPETDDAFKYIPASGGNTFNDKPVSLGVGDKIEVVLPIIYDVQAGSTVAVPIYIRNVAKSPDGFAMFRADLFFDPAFKDTISYVDTELAQPSGVLTVDTSDILQDIVRIEGKWTSNFTEDTLVAYVYFNVVTPLPYGMLAQTIQLQGVQYGFGTSLFSYNGSTYDKILPSGGRFGELVYVPYDGNPLNGNSLILVGQQNVLISQVNGVSYVVANIKYNLSTPSGGQLTKNTVSVIVYGDGEVIGTATGVIDVGTGQVEIIVPLDVDTTSYYDLTYRVVSNENENGQPFTLDIPAYGVVLDVVTEMDRGDVATVPRYPVKTSFVTKFGFSDVLDIQVSGPPAVDEITEFGYEEVVDIEVTGKPAVDEITEFGYEEVVDIEVTGPPSVSEVSDFGYSEVIDIIVE